METFKKTIDNFLTGKVQKCLIEVKGGFGIGKTLSVHHELHYF
jgi:hypothetical protein